MYWRTKAWIQLLVARLPDRMSHPIYYQLQRRFGNLRASRIDPTNRLRTGFDICRQIRAQGRSPVGATFFEVGTGWRINVPIACWLCGADRIITVDLNRYLKLSLVQADLRFIQHNHERLLQQLKTEFGDLIQDERWQKLIEVEANSPTRFRSRCGIEYHAPADAGRTSLTNQSVDFHISCNVLEHVPPENVSAIFREAARIVKPSGLLLHLVDHSDHYSHSDATISPIHFLRYRDEEWNRCAGHRYGFVNRLREDDYLPLFEAAGLHVNQIQSVIDPTVVQRLDRGFLVDARFRGKSTDTLARLNSLFVLAPRGATCQVARAA